MWSFMIFDAIRNFIDNKKKCWAEREKNLKLIDKSIESIIEKLSVDDMSKEEIGSIGLTVLKPFIWQSKSKTIFPILFGIFFTFVVLFCVKTVEPLNRLTSMYGRILLFEVEPYWDWNKWYDSSCLVYNPFYKPKSLKERDCYSCEDISAIERSDENKSEIIAEKYIRNRIPVVIGSDILTDDMKKWQITDREFDLNAIDQIYDEKDWKNVCMFRSNIKASDHLSLLKKIRGKEYSGIGWYAHWENCAKKTEKKMRSLYGRPNILPSMLELTKSNWIVVSNNYVATTYKLIDPMPGTQVLLMFQIRGQIRIKLVPKEFCSSRGCSSLEAVLGPKQMLVMSAELWQLWYYPDSAQFNMAIVIGAIYD